MARCNDAISCAQVCRPFGGIIFPMLLLCDWNHQRKREFSENKETQYLSNCVED